LQENGTVVVGLVTKRSEEKRFEGRGFLLVEEKAQEE
jgi:hypothetical protein